jgi:hypothetical protein
MLPFLRGKIGGIGRLVEVDALDSTADSGSTGTN